MKSHLKDYDEENYLEMTQHPERFVDKRTLEEVADEYLESIKSWAKAVKNHGNKNNRP